MGVEKEWIKGMIRMRMHRRNGGWYEAGREETRTRFTPNSGQRRSHPFMKRVYNQHLRESIQIHTEKTGRDDVCTVEDSRVEVLE